LNEDFISSNGDFINDYSTCSDSSNHSDSQQSHYFPSSSSSSSSLFPSQLAAPLNELEDHQLVQIPCFQNEKTDQDFTNHRYLDDHERLSRYKEFKLDEIDDDDDDNEYDESYLDYGNGYAYGYYQKFYNNPVYKGKIFVFF